MIIIFIVCCCDSWMMLNISFIFLLSCHCKPQRLSASSQRFSQKIRFSRRAWFTPIACSLLFVVAQFRWIPRSVSHLMIFWTKKENKPNNTSHCSSPDNFTRGMFHAAGQLMTDSHVQPVFDTKDFNLWVSLKVRDFGGRIAPTM